MVMEVMFSDAGRMINKVNISAWRKEGVERKCLREKGSEQETTGLSSFIFRSYENFK